MADLAWRHIARDWWELEVDGWGEILTDDAVRAFGRQHGLDVRRWGHVKGSPDRIWLQGPRSKLPYTARLT